MSGDHTPGPWHWTWDGEGQPGRIGVSLPCEPVEECGYLSHCIALTQPGKFDARANAERIVLCVNAHDDLLAAARKAVDECCDLIETPAGRALNAAIAKATGSPA